MYGYVKHPVIKKASFEGTRTGSIFMKKLMNSLFKKDAVFLTQQKEKRRTRFREKHHYRSKRRRIFFWKKQHSLSEEKLSVSEKAAIFFCIVRNLKKETLS